MKLILTMSYLTQYIENIIATCYQYLKIINKILFFLMQSLQNQHVVFTHSSQPGGRKSIGNT